MKPHEIRKMVRERYAKTVLDSSLAPAGENPSSCCGPAPTQVSSASCCGPAPAPMSPTGCCDQTPTQETAGCCGGLISLEELSGTIGYSDQDLTVVPEGANLGLGCGNPQAIASLMPGETVLDLGSGAGFDCFLAARQVGETGQVIGVDMTPEMLNRARENAEQGGIRNVTFRLGEIEHLPLADQSVDVIISNCVINLSPEKGQVFREAYRVLKPGGRLAISDMVSSIPLPTEIQQDAALHACCIAGATPINDLRAMLEAAGFEQISITPKESRPLLQTWGVDTRLEELLFSANIQAVRPQSMPTRIDPTRAGALLRGVAQMHSQLQREGLDSCCGGATGTQCMILTELGRTGPVTLAELVRRVNLDKGWVSRAVEAMAQDGLLAKEPSPTDRRAVIVGMTNAGESLCSDLNATLDSQSDRVLRRIPPAERERVYHSLALLEQALKAELEGNPVLIRLEGE